MHVHNIEDVFKENGHLRLFFDEPRHCPVSSVQGGLFLESSGVQYAPAIEHVPSAVPAAVLRNAFFI